jgi:hypothetical protein
MRVSKFIKPHKDILIEYIYDDGNNISEGYKILQNLRDNSLSYIAASGSVTANTQTNQLVVLDSVTNNYGKVDTTTYAFLQTRDFASGFPIRHDTIKVHLPTNYTFGENLGFYLKVYAYNFTNENKYTLSNFYFDITDVQQSQFLNFNSPPLYFQEKLWGKNVTINIPSVYAVSRQRINNSVRSNTINANLTNNTGFSLTTPVFMEFQFLAAKRTVNRITTYTLSARIPMSLPQAPDFENIGVQIVHSSIGDFFEIYGVFNGDINQFDNFINNSVQLGNRYYVTFTITLFEQNIRGKTFTITLTDNFNEKVEFRPIIKYSTTTAIIDVEMNIIDAVDNSSIYRKASYGMLQDEVAKYSLRLMKINLDNAAKPKIYNIKSPEGAGIFGRNSLNGRLEETKTNIVLEPIKINYAVLADRFNVIAKSDNVAVGNRNFYGLGKLEIILQPFDNIIQLKIARDITLTSAGSSTAAVQTPEYMDMTNMGEIKFMIKDDKISFETGLYFGSNEVDLTRGFVVFRIPSTRMNDIKKISEGGMNLFYVVSRTDTGTTVVYSGLFKIYDSIDNVRLLRNTVNEERNTDSYVVLDTVGEGGVAEVTRRTVTQTIPPNAIRTSDITQLTGNNNNAQNTPTTSESKTTTDTSTKSSYIVGKKEYSIETDSSLVINGYAFSAQNIKAVLNLPIVPTNLTFKGDSLYANGGLLDKVTAIEKKLLLKYISPSAELKNVYKQVQDDFVSRKFPNSQASSFDQESNELVEKEKKKNKIGEDSKKAATEKKKGKLGK